MTAFTCRRAEWPILVSIPHAGLRLDGDMAQRLTPEALELPDTDRHVDRLYDFLDDSDIGVVCARYSRYVVDLNRAPDDSPLYPGQLNSGICPLETFSGAAIYQAGLEPTADEIEDRIDRIWSAYHSCLREEIDRLRRTFGFAILWDAHSILSRVPRLFDGELPHLNIGTNDGFSCDPGLATDVHSTLASGDFSTVVNGRFTGGYITRTYGDPANHTHAIQLEISRRAYMDEPGPGYAARQAQPLQALLSRTFEVLREFQGAG